MANDLLNIRARNIEEVKYLLEGLGGTRVVGIVTEAGANEIVDIMREQPEETPYQYISRAQAYGQVSSDGAPDGYFSMRQFRFVMASLASGEMQIPYQRTGNVSGDWHVEGRLSKARAVDDNPAAPFVFGDKSQSRHEEAVGWSKVGERIAAYSNRILDAAYDAMRAYIARKGR